MQHSTLNVKVADCGSFIEVASALKGMRRLHAREVIGLWKERNEIPLENVWVPEIAVYAKRKGNIHLAIVREEKHHLWDHVSEIGELLTSGINPAQIDDSCGPVGLAYKLFTSGVKVDEIENLAQALEQGQNLSPVQLRDTTYPLGGVRDIGNFLIDFTNPTALGKPNVELAQQFLGEQGDYLINIATLKSKGNGCGITILNPQGETLTELLEGHAVARVCYFQTPHQKERYFGLRANMNDSDLKRDKGIMYALSSEAVNPPLLLAPPSLAPDPVRDEYRRAAQVLLGDREATLRSLGLQEIAGLSGLVTDYLARVGQQDKE